MLVGTLCMPKRRGDMVYLVCVCVCVSACVSVCLCQLTENWRHVDSEASECIGSTLYKVTCFFFFFCGIRKRNEIARNVALFEDVIVLSLF